MTGFIVWYVLAITTIQNGELVSSLSITPDLKACNQLAARMVAADSNARWRCHEMTTEVKPGGLVEIIFPNN